MLKEQNLTMNMSKLKRFDFKKLNCLIFLFKKIHKIHCLMYSINGYTYST